MAETASTACREKPLQAAKIAPGQVQFTWGRSLKCGKESIKTFFGSFLGSLNLTCSPCFTMFHHLSSWFTIQVTSCNITLSASCSTLLAVSPMTCCFDSPSSLFQVSYSSWWLGKRSFIPKKPWNLLHHLASSIVFQIGSNWVTCVTCGQWRVWWVWWVWQEW